MVATMAQCTGCDSSRAKVAHKLGSEGARGEANTWRTFSQAYIDHDGSGYLEVRRGDQRFRFTFGPETEELEVTEEKCA